MVTRLPIRFAREIGTLRAPCYHLIATWLREHGVPNVPSDSAARRQWLENGSEAGARWAAAQIGLVERWPRLPGDICLLEQHDAEPLLALVVDDRNSVVRAFGRLFVGEAKIIVSWGLPCRR